MNSNERERRLLENQRREREEEEIKFASKLSNELKKHHVHPFISTTMKNF